MNKNTFKRVREFVIDNYGKNMANGIIICPKCGAFLEEEDYYDYFDVEPENWICPDCKFDFFHMEYDYEDDMPIMDDFDLEIGFNPYEGDYDYDC